jgi:hypothetical protein
MGYLKEKAVLSAYCENIQSFGERRLNMIKLIYSVIKVEIEDCMQGIPKQKGSVP